MKKAKESNASKIKPVEALVIVCMLLHTVLDIYSFSGSITYGNIADIIVFGLALTVRKSVNIIPFPLWCYIGYRVLMSVLSFSSISSMLPLGFLLQVAALYATFRVVNLSNFIKIFRFLGYTTSIFLLIQYIGLTFFNVRISGILEFLPIAIGGDTYLDVLDLRVRPASIFSEPAHYAQFILPLLCIELFDDTRKKSIPLIILIIAGLLLSMSGTAVLGLLVIGIIYLVKLFVLHASFKKTWWVFLLVALLPVGYQYYAKSELGEMVLGRTESVVEASQAMAVSSEYVRLFRGYDIFGELNVSKKIFGCGTKESIIQSIATTRYSSMFDSENFFFNGIATILLYTGLIGLFIYLWTLINMWKGNSFCGKSFIILLVALMLIASIVINSSGVLFLFLACAYKQENYRKHLLPKSHVS